MTASAAPIRIEPLLACGNCREPMRRLALAGHYGRDVALDLCPGCDLIWFDLAETAQLGGPALLELIGEMSRSHALPHGALRADAACPRCNAGLKIVHGAENGSRAWSRRRVARVRAWTKTSNGRRSLRAGPTRCAQCCSHS